MKRATYECAVCKRTYGYGSEKEAVAEMKRTFGNVSVEDCAIVCDDCYKELGYGMKGTI